VKTVFGLYEMLISVRLERKAGFFERASPSGPHVPPPAEVARPLAAVTRSSEFFFFAAPQKKKDIHPPFPAGL